MSSLSYAAIADLTRQRLGLPVSARLRMQSLVGNALQRLGNQFAQDPYNRQYLLSDRTTTTVALSGGKADLSTLINTNQIELEFLTYGYIYHASDTRPLQWKRGPDMGAIQGAFDGVFKHCWLEGINLYTKGTNNSVLTGSLQLACPYVPTLAQLPEQLENDLIDACVGLARESPDDYMETPGNPA